MKIALSFCAVPIAFTLCLMAQSAKAQDDVSSGWIVTIGPGVAYTSVFPGADKMEIRLWPIIAVRRAGREAPFTTPDDSFGISLIGNRQFRIGPSFTIHRGRDEKDAIAGIGDVGTAIEAGAFAEIYPDEHLRIRADIRKGFGGHKAVVADVGADAILGRPADRFHLSAGPRIRFASHRYMRAFYGIDAQQSALTGFPVYDPGGGLHSIGALGFSSYQLTPRLGIQAYGRYDRLLGDAGDSPLVRSAVGSRNRYETGLGLTYSFTID